MRIRLRRTAKAVAGAEIVVFAFPDHLHGRVFKKDIKPFLKPKSALVFLHGLSVHFGAVIPPKNCDVILLAPLGPGVAVRESYLKGESIHYLYGINQNYSGKAQKTIDYLAKGLKIHKKNLINTTFAEEAIGDIFGEQAVLCGGLSQLIKAGFDTLVDSGLPPDKAYLEVCFQLDLIVDLIKKHGIAGMFDRISLTAKYGSFLAGPQIIDKNVKNRMKKLLSYIKSGQFAAKLNKLDETDIKSLSTLLTKLTSPAFEKSSRKFAK